ncbi:MAG TPA: hypothetical protein VFZ53_17280 [Polyangiaceae bacterium]
MSKTIAVLGLLALLALTAWFVRSTGVAKAEKQPVKRLALDEVRSAAPARAAAANGGTKVIVLPVAVSSAGGVAEEAPPNTENEDWRSDVPTPELERWEQEGQVEFLAKELSRGATSAGTVVTERAMRAAFEQIVVPGVTLGSVRCVTALCEVVLRNQGADTAPLLQAMVEHEVLRGEKLFSYSDDGTSMTVFSAPPGGALPRPPSELAQRAE